MKRCAEVLLPLVFQKKNDKLTNALWISLHTTARNAPSDVFCYRRGGRRTVSSRYWCSLTGTPPHNHALIALSMAQSASEGTP